MSDFAPKVVATLLANGCSFARHGKGDHDIWHSPISKKRFVVDGKIKSRHTANAVFGAGGLAEGVLANRS